MAISTDLQQLVLLNMPEPEQKDSGFLDVVGHQRRENTISNCFAYFLDEDQCPELSRLLVEALLDLIDKKYEAIGVKKELAITDWQVFREYQTENKKGRIDLVLQSVRGQSVVLIEAKVDHVLNNQLDDYWQTFPRIPVNRKAAIVLSNRPMSMNELGHPQFINITHKEWLMQAVQNGVPLGIPIKQQIYFTDFIENMKNISEDAELTEQVNFYFMHSKTIVKAIETRTAAEKFVMGQINLLASKLEFSTEGKGLEYQSIWDEAGKCPVYYTMLPSEILDENGLVRIILEINYPALKLRQECMDLIANDFATDEHREIATYGTKHFQHLLSTSFRLAPNEMAQLSERSHQAIIAYLQPAYDEIYKMLKKHGVHVI